MTKNTIVALVTAAALAGVAAPAFAASSLGSNVGQSYDFDQALSQLQGRGVNAVSVELWGDDVVRAFIANADGSESMAFFTRDTLSPIAR
jgi:sugar/nucleoside kinase (ribokinase family)